MCIMEVRKGQHNSTIQQACTHNVGTVVGDLDMFEQVLMSRDPRKVVEVRRLKEELDNLYQQMCDLYGTFVAEEADHLHPYHGDDELANVGMAERIAHMATSIAHDDINRARKFETR